MSTLPSTTSATSPPLLPASAAQPPGRPELTKALALAQQKCRAVAKDATNTFHRYQYATAESILTEGKAALADTGLALVPLEQTLEGHQKEGQDRFELIRKFLLLHASGECLPLQVAWPVVPDKGRPLDKATASAATASLAYLLRDLLLMPRVDPEDDLPSRENRPAEQPKKPPASAKPALPASGVELDRRVRAYDLHLAQQGLCKAGDLVAYLIAEGSLGGLPADLTRWSGPQVMAEAVEATKEFEAKARRKLTVVEVESLKAALDKAGKTVEAAVVWRGHAPDKPLAGLSEYDRDQLMAYLAPKGKAAPRPAAQEA